MVRYIKLRLILKNRQISTYCLEVRHHFSSSCIQTLRKDGRVRTRTIERICNILCCSPREIMDFQPDAELEYLIRYLSDQKNECSPYG